MNLPASEILQYLRPDAVCVSVRGHDGAPCCEITIEGACGPPRGDISPKLRPFQIFSNRTRIVVEEVFVMELRSYRNLLGISQTRLARLSRVGRFKICMYEIGDGSLTAEEQCRLVAALKCEAQRLRTIAVNPDFGKLVNAVAMECNQ